MLTGMLAVRNLLFDEDHDLWSVNAEQDYHEEHKSEGATTTSHEKLMLEHERNSKIVEVDSVS